MTDIKNLAKATKKLGITRVAKLAGVSRVALSQIVGGKYEFQPSDNLLRSWKLAIKTAIRQEQRKIEAIKKLLKS